MSPFIGDRARQHMARISHRNSVAARAGGPPVEQVLYGEPDGEQHGDDQGQGGGREGW